MFCDNFKKIIKKLQPFIYHAITPLRLNCVMISMDMVFATFLKLGGYYYQKRHEINILLLLNKIYIGGG